MHISIQTAHHEYFVVVVHRVSPKKLLWFLQWAVLPLNLVSLTVETKTIRYPPLVSPKHQYLAIPQSETTNCVTRGPLTILIDQIDLVELLFIQISVTVQLLERIQRCLSLTIPTSHHIQVTRIHHTH